MWAADEHLSHGESVSSIKFSIVVIFIIIIHIVILDHSVAKLCN